MNPASNFARVAAIAAIALFLGGGAPATAADAKLAAGQGSFEFPFESGGMTRRITVWYHRPAAAGADATVAFVLHGAGRTALNYRKYWTPLAEERGFILLVPEFSRDQFPGASYERGNVVGRGGVRYPEAQWSYTAIEDIFDAVRVANVLSARTYDLYGHSAGGQFVHRLVFFKPGARYRVAVAANPGWYMMPDLDVAYPYGLGGSGIGGKQLEQAFARRLVILLGGDDIDPQHYQLRRTPEAMLQGINRLERGHAFYESAKRAAAKMQVPFNWQIRIAPGVAHSNAGMAPFAAEVVGAPRPDDEVGK